MFSKIITRTMLPLLLLLSNGAGISATPSQEKNTEGPTGTLEKLIVASGNVAMELDLKRLNGDGSNATLHFGVEPNSFFSILVLNKELRGPDAGAMGLVPGSAPKLPAALSASLKQLVIEKVSPEEPYDIVVRDAKTGFRFFNIEGHSYEYNADTRLLTIKDGRLLISKEFATQLGRPADANSAVGKISMAGSMTPIEIQKIVNGGVQAVMMPRLPAIAGEETPDVGTVPGPDVIVGDLPAVTQPSGATSGSFVGLGVGTTSCNAGVVDLNWFQLPQVDHPVIPQNLYRMSGGAGNNDRFEQIGQSWLKHAFTALTENVCNYGCNGTGGSHLGSGCSDPYSSGLNASQSGLGSRAWVNPFTGAYPSTAASHTGHTHTGISHRVLVPMSDLNTTMNVGATYFAEGQYVTPHEYAWCPAHAGQCNRYNNVSYRQFNVTGTTSFAFSPVGSTVRQRSAISAWTGATVNTLEPVPGTDGVAMISYKVTNPSAGVWHYEYAVYNQNLDRGIQSFSVPIGCGVTLSNFGFHMPTQEPGWASDGTQNNAGFSSTAWSPTQTANAVTWSCETFAQNQNANAIRWGTLYNFRFDSNKPPQATNATVGFFKTGSPATIAIQGPTPDTCNPLTLATLVSRKTHTGAGDFDINMPTSGTSGVECRNSNGDHTLVFTFSNTVVSGNASVTSGTGNVTGSPTFSGNTMTVNLTGVSDAQTVTVTLSNVTDSNGQVMPSTPFNVSFLVGDTNGDHFVNGGDALQTRNRGGQATDVTNFTSDVNLDGFVNTGDSLIVRSKSGNSVP